MMKFGRISATGHRFGSIDYAASVGFRVTSVTAGTVRPGESLTFNFSDAAGPVTVSTSAGAWPVTSQGVNGAVVTIPELSGFGSRSLRYGQPITFTLSDGTNTAQISKAIAQPAAWKFGLITQVPAGSNYVNDLDVTVGEDYSLADVPANARFDPATGLSSTDGESVIYYKLYDTSSQVWQAEFKRIVYSAVSSVTVEIEYTAGAAEAILRATVVGTPESPVIFEKLEGESWLEVGRDDTAPYATTAAVPVTDGVTVQFRARVSAVESLPKTLAVSALGPIELAQVAPQRVNEGAILSLDLAQYVASDLDLTTALFSLVSSVAGGELAPNGQFTFTRAQAGVSSIGWRVSDGTRTASSTFSVTVNAAPKLVTPLETQTATAGRPFSLDLRNHVADPEGLPLEFAKASGSAAFDVSAAGILSSAQLPQGEFSVGFTAADPDGATFTGLVNFTVAAAVPVGFTQKLTDISGDESVPVAAGTLVTVRLWQEVGSYQATVDAANSVTVIDPAWSGQAGTVKNISVEFGGVYSPVIPKTLETK